MLLPSSRVRRVIYNVGGGAVVLFTWINPGPGVAAMATVVLAVLFCLAMSAGPEESPASETCDCDSCSQREHYCLDDEMEWNDILLKYEWVCPHSETTS